MIFVASGVEKYALLVAIFDPPSMIQSGDD